MQDGQPVPPQRAASSRLAVAGTLNKEKSSETELFLAQASSGDSSSSLPVYVSPLPPIPKPPPRLTSALPPSPPIPSQDPQQDSVASVKEEQQPSEEESSSTIPQEEGKEVNEDTKQEEKHPQESEEEGPESMNGLLPVYIAPELPLVERNVQQPPPPPPIKPIESRKPVTMPVPTRFSPSPSPEQTSGTDTEEETLPPHANYAGKVPRAAELPDLVTNGTRLSQGKSLTSSPVKTEDWRKRSPSSTPTTPTGPTASFAGFGGRKNAGGEGASRIRSNERNNGKERRPVVEDYEDDAETFSSSQSQGSARAPMYYGAGSSSSSSSSSSSYPSPTYEGSSSLHAGHRSPTSPTSPSRMQAGPFFDASQQARKSSLRPGSSTDPKSPVLTNAVPGQFQEGKDGEGELLQVAGTEGGVKRKLTVPGMAGFEYVEDDDEEDELENHVFVHEDENIGGENDGNDGDAEDGESESDGKPRPTSFGRVATKGHPLSTVQHSDAIPAAVEEEPEDDPTIAGDDILGMTLSEVRRLSTAIHGAGPNGRPGKIVVPALPSSPSKDETPRAGPKSPSSQGWPSPPPGSFLTVPDARSPRNQQNQGSTYVPSAPRESSLQLQMSPHAPISEPAPKIGIDPAGSPKWQQRGKPAESTLNVVPPTSNPLYQQYHSAPVSFNPPLPPSSLPPPHLIQPRGPSLGKQASPTTPTAPGLTNSPTTPTAAKSPVKKMVQFQLPPESETESEYESDYSFETSSTTSSFVPAPIAPPPFAPPPDAVVYNPYSMPSPPLIQNPAALPFHLQNPQHPQHGLHLHMIENAPPPSSPPSTDSPVSPRLLQTHFNYTPPPSPPNQPVQGHVPRSGPPGPTTHLPNGARLPPRQNYLVDKSENGGPKVLVLKKFQPPVGKPVVVNTVPVAVPAPGGSPTSGRVLQADRSTSGPNVRSGQVEAGTLKRVEVDTLKRVETFRE
ncbi:hypothetical protein HDU97_001535 [Phlyctochytrium planicorne]|nr:hypothetical protein HDU97_001535 [Phlyctochytrium planicorne]